MRLAQANVANACAGSLSPKGGIAGERSVVEGVRRSKCLDRGGIDFAEFLGA